MIQSSLKQAFPTLPCDHNSGLGWFPLLATLAGLVPCIYVTIHLLPALRQLKRSCIIDAQAVLTIVMLAVAMTFPITCARAAVNGQQGQGTRCLWGAGGINFVGNDLSSLLSSTLSNDQLHSSMFPVEVHAGLLVAGLVCYGVPNSLSSRRDT